MNVNMKNVKISGIRKFYNEVQKVDGAISLTLGPVCLLYTSYKNRISRFL